jgi:ribonuclease E
MLHFDRTGELKSRFLITAVQRNKNSQLRLRALGDVASLRDPDAFDTAIDIIGGWSSEERQEAAKIMLRALVERRIGRRDQASAWIWRLAEYTRDVHEEYAVQRWPETKRLLGLLVNSAGGAHARNARRLIHAARKQDRRLAAALLAAALAHTPEAEEALRGARTRMARKPPALARELLRNFPKRRARNARRRRKGAKSSVNGGGADEVMSSGVDEAHANGAGEARGNSAGEIGGSGADEARGKGADEARGKGADEARGKGADEATGAGSDGVATEALSEAVFGEVLSSEPLPALDSTGELVPAADDTKPQRDSDEALDHVGE